MTLQEKAVIKNYKRKYKNEYKSFNQINLGSSSSFDDGDNVIVIKESDFNDLLFDLKDKDKEFKIMENKLNEYENELKELKNNIDENKQELKKLHNKIDELNQKLQDELNLKSRIIFSYERVISDIQEKRLFKLLNLNLPESYKKLSEFKEAE